jgi:hypothetical protein
MTQVASAHLGESLGTDFFSVRATPMPDPRATSTVRMLSSGITRPPLWLATAAASDRHRRRPRLHRKEGTNNRFGFVCLGRCPAGGSLRQ